MSAPTVAVTGLTQRHGTSFTLEVERFVTARGATAVLGPNGSGKTTLLRILATLTQPQVGSIRVELLNPSVPLERTAIRRRLGYVAQSDGLPGRMRVSEFCDYIGALKEIGPDRLRRRWSAWALDRVGLTDVSGDRIRTLSGGMKRRLSIAQALLGGPDLLVLDEPLASLDAEQRGEIAGLLAQLAANANIIVATHHADELASVCGQVVVLHGGRMAFVGSPSELAALADGRVWESGAPTDGATCRAVGPGRFHCVGVSPPSGSEPARPTVADGYLTLVRHH